MIVNTIFKLYDTGKYKSLKQVLKQALDIELDYFISLVSNMDRLSVEFILKAFEAKQKAR